MVELLRWQDATDDPLRIPEKLQQLTNEHDTSETWVFKEDWQYPGYLYDLE